MFEPENLHFNFIDILGAPRRALKAKKIWAHLMGLMLAYPFYVVLTYLALLSEGRSLTSTWNQYGIYPFFPWGSGELSSLSSWAIYALGLLVFAIITLLAGTIVSRIVYKELKGDPFYSIKDALTFTRRHGRTVAFAPLAVVLIILFFLAMATLMALIGKIPYLGDVIFVGLYPLYFVGSVFTLFTGVVLAVLLLYLPTIIAAWEEDAMGSTFQAYTITWNQPWRVVIYSGLIGALAMAGAFIYGWVITAGYHFINRVFGPGWLMGDKLGPILAWAEQIVFSGYSRLFSYIPGQGAVLSPLTTGLHASAVTGWEAFMGSILALLLLLIYGSVWAYGLSIISVGQSLAFLIYKFKTDDENLLERKDEEDLAAEDAEKSAGQQEGNASESSAADEGQDEAQP